MAADDRQMVHGVDQQRHGIVGRDDGPLTRLRIVRAVDLNEKHRGSYYKASQRNDRTRVRVPCTFDGTSSDSLTYPSM